MATISVSLPSDGTAADVSDYNTPITTIVNEVNGNLDNANIKSGAAIATSKLADDAGITTAKIADGAVTPAKLGTHIKGGTISITATGSLATTGLGFQPVAVQFFQVGIVSGTTAGAAYGYMDAGTQWAQAVLSNEGTGDTSNVSSTSNCILTVAANSAADIAATRTSLDADGFTINVASKTNNRVFGYIAFG